MRKILFIILLILSLVQISLLLGGYLQAQSNQSQSNKTQSTQTQANKTQSGSQKEGKCPEIQLSKDWCPQTPADYFTKIYQISLGVGVVLAVIMIIYGGVLYATARDNVSQQKEAREYITQALFGLAILFGAVLILRTVNPDLVKLGRWQEVSKERKIPVEVKKVSVRSPELDRFLECLKNARAARTACYEKCYSQYGPPDPELSKNKGFDRWTCLQECDKKFDESQKNCTMEFFSSLKQE